MIRYHYAEQLTPPAPFVNVTLRCNATGQEISGLPALLDPAADRTVVPGRIIASLQLVEDGRSLFQGFAGDIISLPLFLTEIQVHDRAPLMIRVVVGSGEPYILLGRDVLNVYRIVLDGPELAVEIH